MSCRSNTWKHSCSLCLENMFDVGWGPQSSGSHSSLCLCFPLSYSSLALLYQTCVFGFWNKHVLVQKGFSQVGGSLFPHFRSLLLCLFGTFPALLIIFTFTYLCVCVCVCMSEGHRTTCRSWSSPTMDTPRMELISPAPLPAESSGWLTVPSFQRSKHSNGYRRQSL